MGFFDGLAAAEELAVTARQVGVGPSIPPEQDGSGSEPYLPAMIADTREVGAGPDVRIRLARMSVWPDAVTLHLAVFVRSGRSTPWNPTLDPRTRGGLRVGLLLSDGRRVTTLDTEPPSVCPPPADSARPLRLGQVSAVGRGLRYDVELALSGLPPEGPTELVVEWPAEQVPETHTPFSAVMIRAAARMAVDVWASTPRSPTTSGRPGSQLRATLEERPSQRESVLRALADRKRRQSGVAFGPSPASGREPMPARKPQRYEPGRQRVPADPGGARAAVDPARYEPRPDWDGIGPFDWSDLALITARLDDRN